MSDKPIDTASLDGLFEQFARNAPVGMYVKDGAGRYLMVNPEMEKLFGQPVDAVVGKSVRDMLSPEDAAMVEAHDAEIRRSRQPQAVVEQIDDADDYEHTLVVRFPLDHPADPDMIGGFEIDLTAQKRAEAEAARARAALNQAERMSALGSLLAGVSHELNNPLAIVVGEAEMLAEDAQDDAQAEAARRIHAAASRCAAIVQSFLAMARQKPAERRRTDLAALIDEAVALTQYQMKSSGTSVDLDIAPDLPRIHADADQLQQVFLNLLVNAQQALEARPQPRLVRIQAARQGEEIVVRIADNGPGIAPEIAPRIFDPFFTTKPEGTGNGIGLAYSQGVVEAHAGSLSLAAPAPGEGAVFEIRLPVDPGEAEPLLDPA